MADGLNIEDNGAGFRVRSEIVNQVAKTDIQLVAYGCKQGQTDACVRGPVQHGIGEGLGF
jgi:hypothetical protein